MVALGLILGGALNLVPTARAERAAVRVVPRVDLQAFAERGAIGLLVPGSGSSVSRDSALAALLRGKVRNSLVSGPPSGLPVIRLGGPPAPVTIYVELPGPGRRPNERRYPIAIVGPGYRGILISRATRIRGLVSVADVAPTVRALERARTPTIGSAPERDAASDLRRLDRTLVRRHGERNPTRLVLVVAILIALAAGLLARRLGREGLICIPVALAICLVWAATGSRQPWPEFAVLLAVCTFVLARLLDGPDRLAAALGLFLTAYLVVLAAWPETNALAALGPHPDGGGRFYGITNEVETFLLAPVLALGLLVPLALLPAVAALSLVLVGWSEAGADGGGVIVFAVALGVLALRRLELSLTPRRIVLVGAAAVLVGLALVGIDAALGGSSHVTRAVGSGPGSLLGDLGDRVRLSYLGAVSSWQKLVYIALSLVALVVFGTRRPRLATVDALLAGVAVSLLVNDTPRDVLGIGALVCASLWTWERLDPASGRTAGVHSRPMRSGAAAASLVLVLVLAGCGSKGVVRAAPQTVVGTVQQEDPGKAVFASNGCNGCHTYKPAAATAKIGPDLDKLAQYAKQAKQPLAAFTKESIVDPNKYIQKGFPKGVMPQTYKSLPPDQIQALVGYLTKPKS